MIRLLLLCCAICFGTTAMSKDRLTIAVATNFADTLAALEPVFEASHDTDLILVSGASGTLFAQIKNGAPYDVFLSADQVRPAHLHDAGLAGKPVTYVHGQLVLWGRNADVSAASLTDPDLRFVAMASPPVAPYGLAAEQTLAALNLTATLDGKLVLGQNIGQAFAMAATGAADLAFIAKSAALTHTAAKAGTYWVVPTDLYAPITQDATVIINRNEISASAFLTFLKSPKAQNILRDHGYEVPAQ